jgi:hypothetical protein
LRFYLSGRFQKGVVVINCRLFVLASCAALASCTNGTVGNSASETISGLNGASGNGGTDQPPVTITPLRGVFDPAVHTALNYSPVTDATTMPIAGTVSYAGKASVGGTFGEVSLDVSFADLQITGVADRFVVNDNGTARPVAGHLDMTGSIVSRIGLRLDVDGTVSLPDQGAVPVMGVIRGVFHGTAATALVATADLTTPTSLTPTLSGSLYAQARPPSAP